MLGLLVVPASPLASTPARAAGPPIVHFDATALALADLDLVTTWGGQSASGSPTFRENQTPRGQPAVEFNGSDRMGNNVSLSPSAAGDWIVAAVIKPTNTGGYHNLIDDDSSNDPMLWIAPGFRYELNRDYTAPFAAAGTGPGGWDIVIADSRFGDLYVNSPTPTETNGRDVAFATAEAFDFFHRDGGQTFKGLVAELRVYNDRADFDNDFAALYGELSDKYFGITLDAASTFVDPPECRGSFPDPQCRAQAYDTSLNLAAQANGASPAVAKDGIGGYGAIHRPQYANDGYYGNGASWISASGNSWVKIDLGSCASIESLRFGRDRTGGFNDRDPGRVRIFVAESDDTYANGNATNDASEYTQVFDSAPGYNGVINGAATLKASFAPATGRYIKIQVQNSGAAIDEFEVAGQAGVPGCGVPPDLENFAFDVVDDSGAVGVTEVGVGVVPIIDIPIEAIVGTSGAGFESAPLGSIPLGSIPLGSIDLDASPLGSIPLGSIPLGSIDIAGLPLGSIQLSTVPLGSIGGWETVLAGTELAGVPLQNVTLDQVLALDPAPSGVAGIALSDVALDASPLGSISLPSLALGDQPLESVAPSLTLCGTELAGYDCNTKSLFELEIASAPLGSIPLGSIPLGSIPLGSIPLGSIPLGSIPLGSIPVGSIDLLGTPLGSIPLGSIPLGSIPLGSIPLGSIDLAGTPLGSIPLGSIGTTGACDELASPLDCTTLGVATGGTLLDLVAALEGAGEGVASTPLGSIPLGSIPLGSIPLGSIPVGSIPLGSIPLGSIELAASPLGSIPLGSIELPGGFASTCAFLLSEAAPCPASIDDDSKLFEYVSATGGTLASTPLGSIPLGSIPVAETPLGSIDLATVEINGSPLGSIPLGSIGLGSTGLAGSPLGSIPLGSIPVGSIDLAVDCSLVDCATGTLGDAELVGAILPDATVGDLGFYGTVTLGELADSLTMELLYGPGTLGDGSDYGDLTLGQILVSLLLQSDYPWESLDLQSLPLQDIAPTGSVTYSMSFDLTGDGVGLEGTATATIPSGFMYQSGSASLAAVGAVETPLADPAILGNDLTFDLQLDAGVSYVVRFDAVPGLNTGTFATRASIGFPTAIPAPTGPAADTTSITVQEYFADSDFSAPTVIESDTLVFSHISAPNQTDFFDFPATVGFRHAVFVSQFDQDTDLVLYKPATAPVSQVAPRSVPLGSIPIEDEGINYGGNQTQQPELEADINIESAPLGSISINRGTTPEAAASTLSSTAIGDSSYTIQVSGYQGLASSSPYVVRVKKEQDVAIPFCESPVFPAADVALPASVPVWDLAAAGDLPADLNTIFLLNWDRLVAAYPGPVGDETANAAAIVDAINALVTDGANGVVGAVIPVDEYSVELDLGGVPTVVSVSDLYDGWDANPCDPNNANTVVSAIADVVSQIQAARPTLTYVTIVGNDDIIPFARINDLTSIANEDTYTEQFAGTALYGSLLTRNFLSDDPYVDLDPIPWLDRYLHVPDLAVGRLVEQPADIVLALENFVTFNGLLDPQTASVSGYDFLDDGTTDVWDRLADIHGPGNVTGLIDAAGLDSGATWNKAALLDELDLVDASPGSDIADIISVNAHSDHYRQLPSRGDATGIETDLFEVGDLNVLPESLFGKLAFTMGCHAGLSVSDIGVGNGNPGDWAQTYLSQGALYVGNSGYGYGDTASVALTERLMADFAEKLDGSLSVGSAMTFAKQEYFAQLGQYGVYDEKALQQVIFYGLPMYSLGGLSPAANPAALATAGVPGTALQAATVGFAPSFQSKTVPGRGTYLSVDGQAQQTHSRPIQPIDSVDITQDDLVAHGAIVIGATTVEEAGVDPVYFRPNVTGAATREPEAPSDEIATPTFGLNVATYNRPATVPGGAPFEQGQQLTLIAGSFRSPQNDSQIGVQRKITDAQVKVFYADPAVTDFSAPRIRSVGSTLLGSQVSFTVETDAADVAQVLVLYRNAVDGGVSQWVTTALAAGGTGTYTGGGPVDPSGVIGDVVDYKVWVVDTSGNVATTDFKNVFWQAATPPPPTSSASLSLAYSDPSATGWYSGPVTVTVSGESGVTYSYTAPGVSGTGQGPSFQFQVPSSGINAVEVSGGGQTATAILLIDATPPGEPIIATPSTSHVFVQDAAAAFDFSCPDAGSGAISCTGAVTGPVTQSGIESGDAIPLGSLGMYDLTVTATDIFGATNQATTTFYVTPPLTISGGSEPVALGSPTEVAASITGVPGATALWDWGDGTSPETIAAGSPGTPLDASGSHTYAEPGVYRIQLTMDYGSGFVQTAAFEFAVIYDPQGGFVTGGGWIESPVGTYPAQPDLTGRANFGFVSKYKKGQSVPSGNTTFKFKAGDLNFTSTSYEWLVIAGHNAKYKGVGTINGSGNYGFMLTSCDVDVDGSCQGGDGDTFRIKIWDKDDGDVVVYDNVMGAGDDSNAGTVIGGGSIVIHAPPKGNN